MIRALLRTLLRVATAPIRFMQAALDAAIGTEDWEWWDD